MAVTYLALGSNLDDRELNLKLAVEELKAMGLQIEKISTIIETDPVGGPSQGKFLNAVVKVRTELSPEKLLVEIQKIEKKLGRVRTVVHGPRTIDIDILLYDHLEIRTPQLNIPHPRLFERDFVMIPLKEIEPNITRDFSYESHSNH